MTDFLDSNLSSRLHDRAASFSRDDDHEAERVRYMEQILAHYMPNTSFDIPSLRKIAEDLQKRHHDLSESDGPPTQAEGDDLDDLAIDEEDFSIRAFPDNTTREFPPSRLPRGVFLGGWDRDEGSRLLTYMQTTPESFHT